MRQAFNWFLNIFALTFAIPSFLIIISWNALPGERLYGIKKGLEDTALFITIKTPLAPILSVKYTERRFTEANTLLNQKGSTLGYALLVEEARSSRDIILDKSDAGQAEELVSKIDAFQQKIEAKKLAITSGQENVPVAYATTNLPVAAPVTQVVVNTVYIVVTPTPVPVIVTQANTSQDVVNDLEKTDQELESIKEALKRLRRENRENRNNREERGSEHAPAEQPAPIAPPETAAPTVAPEVTQPETIQQNYP